MISFITCNDWLINTVEQVSFSRLIKRTQTYSAWNRKALERPPYYTTNIQSQDAPIGVEPIIIGWYLVIGQWSQTRPIKRANQMTQSSTVYYLAHSLLLAPVLYLLVFILIRNNTSKIGIVSSSTTNDIWCQYPKQKHTGSNPLTCIIRISWWSCRLTGIIIGRYCFPSLWSVIDPPKTPDWSIPNLI